MFNYREHKFEIFKCMDKYFIDVCLFYKLNSPSEEELFKYLEEIGFMEEIQKIAENNFKSDNE